MSHKMILKIMTLSIKRWQSKSFIKEARTEWVKIILKENETIHAN